MVPRIVSNRALEVLPFDDAVWYVDAGAGEAGQLQIAQPPAQIAQLLDMPPLAEIDVPVVSEVLRELVPDLPPPSTERLRAIAKPLTPMLLLDTSEPSWMSGFRGYRYGTQKLDFVRVKFRYGEAVMPADHPGEFVTLQNGETVRVTRDSKAEKRFLKSLGEYGLEEVPSFGLSGTIGERPIFALENEKAWPFFHAANGSADAGRGLGGRHSAGFPPPCSPSGSMGSGIWRAGGWLVQPEHGHCGQWPAIAAGANAA